MSIEHTPSHLYSQYRSYPAPAAPLVRALAALSRALDLGSAVAGLVCLYDVLAQSLFTGGHAPHRICYSLYFILLPCYAAVREWEKWKDPSQEYASRSGHLFVAAWFGLPALIALLQAGGWHAVWPADLTTTFRCVLGCCFGTCLFDSLRRSKRPSPNNDLLAQADDTSLF